jgi:HSP20 family protein
VNKREEAMSEFDRNFWKKLRSQAQKTIGDSFWQDLTGLLPNQSPRVDVYQTAEHTFAVIELPGWDNDGTLKLTMHRNTLHIKGDIPCPYPIGEDSLIVSERFFGPFQRKIELPPDTASEGMKAVYDNGLLTVTFLRAKSEDAPVTIDIQLPEQKGGVK